MVGSAVITGALPASTRGPGSQLKTPLDVSLEELSQRGGLPGPLNHPSRRIFRTRQRSEATRTTPKRLALTGPKLMAGIGGCSCHSMESGCVERALNFLSTWWYFGTC